jgi:hypothetical protein
VKNFINRFWLSFFKLWSGTGFTEDLERKTIK